MRKGESSSVVTSPATATGMLNASAMMDAMNVLVQLGESRIDARALIDLALEREPDLSTANTLVAAALASKGMTR